MQIEVIASVNEAVSDDFLHKTVVVIDVLRATSTMITALEHGCTAIKPVETVSQARNLQQHEHEWLGGERHCKKIPGFQLGNSPLEYTSEQIHGKTIILTTTNGTRAFVKADKAKTVLAGAMLNAAACAEAVISLRRDAVILCAGTQGAFALEDGLCAGMIVAELLSRSKQQPQINDFGLAMLYTYRQRNDDLTETLLAGSSGARLVNLGLKDDVLFCAQQNTCDLVPVLQNNSLQRGLF